MKQLIFSLIFLLLGVFGLPAQLVEQRLIPVDDTYTYSDNTIRGMEPLLKTYHSTAGAQFRRISFLKFDISKLSPFVETVKLRLYTNGFPAGGDNAHQFDLYPVAKNSWSEDDVTFLNFVEKLGADITTPVLASYIVPAGAALSAQYIEFSGPNLTKYLADSLAAGKQFISLRMRERNVVRVGTSAVIVEFHSKENTSELTPELVVEEKDVEMLKIADLQIDGNAIVSFSESQYRYDFSLPWNAVEIPVVSATPKYEDAVVTVTQASSLTGNEASRTARVNVQKGTDVLTYSVVFSLLPPPNDARLASVLVDGKPLEFFDKDRPDYTVYLPYSATMVPEVAVIPFESSAVTQVVVAESINPADAEAMRTATLNVTSGDGTASKVYRIVFHQLPELDIILALGQSNMAGRANFSDYTGNMPGVYLLTPSGEFEVSSNPMNRHANIRKDLSLQKLGPSYSCALKLQEHLSRPVAFVVNAQGGSSITTWYQSGKSNYDASIVRAKEAQRFGRIRAVIWHQGESDSSNSGTYMDRLKTMVESLRNDLGEPDLYFVAGELAYWRGGGTASNAFNSMIRTIADHIPNTAWISAEGCTPLIDVNDPHFDTPSAILLGERYAEKMIEGVYSTTALKSEPATPQPRFVQEPGGILLESRQYAFNFLLYNLMGQVIRQGHIPPYESVRVSIEKGIYLLSFIQEEEKVTSRKLILY